FNANWRHPPSFVVFLLFGGVDVDLTKQVAEQRFEPTQIATQSHHIAHIKSKSVKSKPDKFEPIFRF
ncbi:hypothetical protein OAF42_02645, partial [Planctomicrobium sp.]